MRTTKSNSFLKTARRRGRGMTFTYALFLAVAVAAIVAKIYFF